MEYIVSLGISLFILFSVSCDLGNNNPSSCDCPSSDSIPSDDHSGNNIKKIKVTHTLNIPGNPDGLVMDLNKNMAYVTNRSGLIEIDASRKNVIRNIALPNSQVQISGISQDGKLLSLNDFYSVYIANTEGELSFLKTITGSAVFGSCIVGSTVYAASFNDRIIYSYRLEDGLLHKIDPYKSSGEIATPNSIISTADQKYVVAVDETNRVLHVISCDKDSSLYHIPTGQLVKFCIPIKDDKIAAFLENSKQLLLIDITQPNVIPEIMEIDSLEYVNHAVYSSEMHFMFVILGKLAFYRDSGPYESSNYYTAELMILDMNTKKEVLRGKIDIDPSNVEFKIGMTSDNKSILFTSSGALNYIDIESLKIL